MFSETGSSLGAALRLKDEGMFFVNGAVKSTTTLPLFPGEPPTPGAIVVKQMFVHFRVPERTSEPPERYPLVFVHGGGLTGMAFETTPDGREGWATYFTRAGHTTYVVDLPGRGRSGFDATNNIPERITQVTLQNAWTVFRFGPRLGEPFPGVQFPVDAMLEFGSQGVPLTDAILDGGPTVNGPAALSALLDRIGPAILIVHSQSGPIADILAGRRPEMIKAVINIEGSHAVEPTQDQIRAYRRFPVLELFGDNLDHDPNGWTSGIRLNARRGVAQRINAAGGNATVLILPDMGIRGNTHMMMQDANNLEVAGVIERWLAENLR